MVSHPPSSSDRQPNSRSGAGNAHGKVEKTPGTSRREGGVGKEKPVLEVLEDYVESPRSRGWNTVADIYLDSWRMFRERSVWFGLQGLQLGNWGSCGCEADQDGKPAQKRIADDRGTNGSSGERLRVDICLGRNRPFEKLECEFTPLSLESWKLC